MKPTSTPTIHIGLAALLLLTFGCADRTASVKKFDDCTLAISDVSILPMDVERVLANRTVRLQGARISAIEASGADSAAGCKEVVDGSGMFLVPGLNDMHVHLQTAAVAVALGLPADAVDFDAAFVPYLAHGVTGIRVMSGAPDILAVQGNEPGHPRPLLSVGSPMLSGDPPVLPEPLTHIVRSPAEARVAVGRFADEGYGFIKIRDNLDVPVFLAVIGEATRLGLYVEGHVVKTLSIDEVLASGQRGFSHADNLVLAMQDPTADGERFIAALRQCACFVTSTLIVVRSAQEQIDDYDAAITRPETGYVPPLVREAFWKKPNNPYLNQNIPEGFFDEVLKRGKQLVKLLSDAGVTVLAGSDALNPMVAPGAGLHDELAILLQAGLSPFEVLSTATANTTAVPGFESTGILAPGRRANALLVRGNPLRDLSVLRRPEAVVVEGRLLDRQQLDGMLEALVANHLAGIGN